MLCVLVALTVSCSKSSDEMDIGWVEYNEARKAKDMGRTLAAIDSMETAKLISTVKADYLRGLAYDNGWQMRIAEQYYREAHEGFGSKTFKDFTEQDWHDYADSGYRWAYLCANRGDIEGALDVASRLLAQAEGNDAFPKGMEAALVMLMADCQMQLHQWEECRQSCEKAYQTQLMIVGDKPIDRFNLVVVCMSISSHYFDMGDIQSAQEWLARCEEEFGRYEAQGDSMLIEEYKGHIALRRARYLQATGHAVEAAAAYAAVPRRRIFEPRAYTEAASYLMAAGRYDEAAYWYEQIDSTYIATDGAKMTFDIIASRLMPRYTAYRKGGRNAEALVIADSISTAIDSALVWQKKNDAAELAVIYQTHERELRLTDLRLAITLHRVIVAALVVILLLVGYLLWRSHKYNRLLAIKNHSLYEQIQGREKAEAKQYEEMQARPNDTLSQNQQLYNRLCELMRNPAIYTDSNTNHETLARLLGTNHTYLYAALRECAGQTPADFINLYRIRHAALLLTKSDDSVGLIIEQSGITNRSTFNRLFREHYSMSPSEYRNAANFSEQ